DEEENKQSGEEIILEKSNIVDKSSQQSSVPTKSESKSKKQKRRKSKPVEVEFTPLHKISRQRKQNRILPVPEPIVKQISKPNINQNMNPNMNQNMNQNLKNVKPNSKPNSKSNTKSKKKISQIQNPFANLRLKKNINVKKEIETVFTVRNFMKLVSIVVI